MLRLIAGASLCLWFGFGINATDENWTEPPGPTLPVPNPEIVCQERVIEMIPYSRNRGFNDVDKVTLRMYCEGNAYSRMTLEYQIEGTLVMNELVVEQVPLVADCGHSTYFAHLPPDELSGRRFSVELTDLYSESCYESPFQWTAQVKTGFGWCGTMDAVMTLIEKPYDPFSRR